MFRELFKSLKRQKTGLKICPKCGSPDIHLSSILNGWLMPEKYLCAECSYSGFMVVELEDNKPENSSQEH